MLPTMTASTTAISTPVAISILLVGQLALQGEGEDADGERGGEADARAEHARPGARGHLQVLDEQHGLEALAVDRGEAEDRQTDRLAGEEADLLERLAAAVEARDPLAPVDAVEEPVGDHEQHRDRDDPGDRLQPQPAGAELVDQQLDDQPRERGRADAGDATEQHRPPQVLARADEARGDRGQDQDGLQALRGTRGSPRR